MNAMSDNQRKIEIIDDKPLTFSMYTEKMTDLMVQEYNDPEHFFAIAKNAYLQNYKYFTYVERSKAIISIFRDAYRAYNTEWKRKLYQSFLKFTSDLPLGGADFANLFESFFLMLKNRDEKIDFFVDATRCGCYVVVINRIVRDEFFEKYYSFFHSFSINDASALVKILYDSTLFSLVRGFNDSYYEYDNYIAAIVKSERADAIKELLNNPNIVFGSYARSLLDEYLSKTTDESMHKLALYFKLRGYSVKFSDFVEYVKSLTPEEHRAKHGELLNIAHRNHFDKGYDILLGTDKGTTILRTLSLTEFIVLSDIIKEKYHEKYLSALCSAIKKKLRKRDDYDDVFECMEKYPENMGEFLKIPGIQEYSLLSDSYRSKFMAVLKKQNMLDQLPIMKYGG
jgi:hypothetical protein